MTENILRELDVEDLALLETCLFGALDRSRCDCLNENDRQKAVYVLDKVQALMLRELSITGTINV
jgi:hypothetical protein